MSWKRILKRSLLRKRNLLLLFFGIVYIFLFLLKLQSSELLAIERRRGDFNSAVVNINIFNVGIKNGSSKKIDKNAHLKQRKNHDIKDSRIIYKGSRRQKLDNKGDELFSSENTHFIKPLQKVGELNTEKQPKNFVVNENKNGFTQNFSQPIPLHSTTKTMLNVLATTLQTNRLETRATQVARNTTLKRSIIRPASTSNSKPNCSFRRLSLKRGIDFTLDSNVKCKQHQSSQRACAYVTDYYRYQFENQTCGSKEVINICQFSETIGRFKCNYKACGNDFHDEILLHLLDIKSGLVRPIIQGFESSREIAKNVMKYAKYAVRKGINFLFLSCGDEQTKAQLLLLDKEKIIKSKSKKKRKIDKQTSKINVNILFLDSLARAHFYRSLKRTVDFMEQVNRNTSTKSEILDFELFQSIHGHTAENMVALFTGKKFPRAMTDNEREKSQTHIQAFFKYIKDKGYRVMYQEDECWQSEWGLFTDLGKFDGWYDFYKHVKTHSFINDIGLTFASCKIIELYEPQEKHVFNTDAKVCYNGLSMDGYFLRYLSQTLESSETPQFSFTTLNIAHDTEGKRLQGIDEQLKVFLKDAVESDNTLTIMFSDHGNTYTEYVYLDIEGRYEMYHPQLFLVIPGGVQKKFGPQIMHNMRKNQNRLLNLIDIHHTIKHVVDRNHPEKGILDLLSENRTCASIPMSMPNLCVCDGWDSPVENKTDLMPFVEFAIGHINNLISDASPTMRCKRLVPTSFQNVMQQKHGDDAILKFDFLTLPGAGSKNKEERISVELSHKVSDSLNHFDTKLISYDRISKFGDYRKCSDAETKFRYCVCNQEISFETANLTSFTDLSPARNDYAYRIFDGNIEEEIFERANGNLGFIARYLYGKSDIKEESDKSERQLVSASYEVINLSSSQPYEVGVQLEDFYNMKKLNNQSCTGRIEPNRMLYLCTVKRKWSVITSSVNATFMYRKIDL